MRPVRHRLPWAASAALAALLGVVAFSDATLLNRAPEPAGVEREATHRLWEDIERFETGRGTVDVSVEAAAAGDAPPTIRVGVWQPEPRLHALDVRFHTMGAGLPSAALRLGVPGGDWPPMVHGTTDDGDQRFAAENLDFNTTSVDFHLPAHLADELPEELLVDVAVDLRGSPSLTSWQTTVHARVPLADLGELCIDLNRDPRERLQALAHIDRDRAREVIAGRPYEAVGDLARAGFDDAEIADIERPGVAAADC